jgi:hypothetical protein
MGLREQPAIEQTARCDTMLISFQVPRQQLLRYAITNIVRKDMVLLHTEVL